MLKCVLFGCFLFMVTPGFFAYGQPTQASLEEAYDSASGGFRDLYTGRQPALYAATIQGHPYFGSGNWSSGLVQYKDRSFAGAFLYDLVADRILVDDSFHGGIELITEQLPAFQLDGRIFRRFSAADINTALFSPGYYEVLYDGQIQALCRHSKIIRKENRDFREVQHFEEVTRYLVGTPGHYTRVKNKATLVKALQLIDKTMARTLRKSSLDFRNFFEASLVQFLHDYESNRL